ncbi:MAG: glycosyltransferase family 4 protein, partial [Opitutaceae bacterium]|nr:glycosyltransferase family 4 protein [Opitutaceae bacterium]
PFGNVLTEAMASGLAVAGYDYAAARQFVHHGENGLVAPCGMPESLQAAAVSLARDATLRGRLRQAAPASLAEQSWEKVIARFEADLIRATDQKTPSTEAVTA